MSSTQLAGSSLLSNLKNKRENFEKEIYEIDLNNKIRENNQDFDLIDQNQLDIEVNINDYIDKPLEVLMNDMKALTDSKTIKNESDYIDIEYIEDYTDNEYVDITLLDDSAKETVYYDMEKEEGISKIELPIDNDILMRLKVLESDVQAKEQAILEKESQINYLIKENEELQKISLIEQDLIIDEEDLLSKTLTKAEKLLLDKREELIERQKASKKGWFFKLINKVRA